MRSISTEGGVEGRVLLGVSDELLLRWEGWEVVVIVNATGKWSFYTIVQTILIGFSTDFLYFKILALGRGISSSFCHAKAKLPRKHWTSTFCRRKISASNSGHHSFTSQVSLVFTQEVIGSGPGKEGKEEVQNNTQAYTTQEGIEPIKNNTRVYTSQEDIEQIKNTPQVYTTQEDIEQIKNNPQVYTSQKG